MLAGDVAHRVGQVAEHVELVELRHVEQVAEVPVEVAVDVPGAPVAEVAVVDVLPLHRVVLGDHHHVELEGGEHLVGQRRVIEHIAQLDARHDGQLAVEDPARLGRLEHRLPGCAARTFPAPRCAARSGR